MIFWGEKVEKGSIVGVACVRKCMSISTQTLLCCSIFPKGLSSNANSCMLYIHVPGERNEKRT